MNASMRTLFEIVRQRTLGAVEQSIAQLTDIACKGPGNAAFVLYCIQPRPNNYYRLLSKDFEIELVKQRWNRSLKGTLSRMFLGRAALILVREPSDIPDVFRRISEQSLGAICVLSVEVLQDIFMSPFFDFAEVISSMKKDPLHVVYAIDEDSATEGDLVVELISLGMACPSEMLKALQLDTSEGRGSTEK